MYDLKIYLAGKMSGLSFEEMNNWRVKIKNQLKLYANFYGCKTKVVNPVDYYNYTESRHQSEKEIEDYDLAHVISSDIIVVNLDGLNSSDGTKYEIFEAYRHYHIPVIAFGDRELYDQLHPWVRSKITRVESNINDLCEYICNYYMN